MIIKETRMKCVDSFGSVLLDSIVVKVVVVIVVDVALFAVDSMTQLLKSF